MIGSECNVCMSSDPIDGYPFFSKKFGQYVESNLQFGQNSSKTLQMCHTKLQNVPTCYTKYILIFY